MMRQKVPRSRRYGRGATSFTARDVFSRDGGRCGICARDIDLSLPRFHPAAFQVDHILPRTWRRDLYIGNLRLVVTIAGPDTFANMQAAHRLCNLRKNNSRPRPTDEELDEAVRRAVDNLSDGLRYFGLGFPAAAKLEALAVAKIRAVA